MSKSEGESETFSYKDCPVCPDLRHKIDRIYVALLGADGMGLTDGIVHALTQLQKNQQVESSWIKVFRPLLIGVVSAAVASGITYLLIIH